MKRLLLAALLLTGCGPQPWSPSTTQTMLTQFQQAGANPTLAACMVQEMQKRVSEADLQAQMLEAERTGRLNDAADRTRQEVTAACK